MVTELGEKRSIAVSMRFVARVALAEGRLGDAQTHFGQALEFARELGDKREVVQALIGLARVWVSTADIDSALTFLEEGLAIARELGSRPLEASALQVLGAARRVQGDIGESIRHAHEALLLHGQIGYKLGFVECLEDLAGLAAEVGDHNRAAKLYGASEGLRRTMGSIRSPSLKDDFDRKIVRLQDNLEEDFKACWDQGIVMSEEEIFTEANELSPG